MHSNFLPFRVPKRAYVLGMFAAHYWQQSCCLCHMKISNPIKPLQKNGLKQTYFTNRHFNKRWDKGLLCIDCQQTFLPIPPIFLVQVSHQQLLKNTSVSIQSSFIYQYPLNQIIRRFKFNQDMRLLPALIYLLQQLPRPHGCHASNSVILPMPTTKQRLKIRGFDPVSILVSHLSKLWDIPIWNGVKRVDNTEHQSGLSRAERLQNLQNAFVIIKPLPVSRVILFDDVVTTGASMSTLANTLLVTSDRLKLCGYCVAHVDI